MMAPFPLRASSAHRSQGVSSMSGVGQRFPQFSLTGVVSSDVHHAFQSFTQDSFPGKWRGGFFSSQDLTLLLPPPTAPLRRAAEGVLPRHARRPGAPLDQRKTDPPPRGG